MALAIAGMLGAFLFLTYYLQLVLHYSPVQAGLAFLPIAVASQVASWGIASRLMPHVPPRALMAPGAVVAAAGLLLLTQLHAGGGYVAGVLPAEVLLGMGIACVMVPAFSIGTLGVDPREAGVAAAMVNTAQQVGGSLGVGLLNTVASGATASYAVTVGRAAPGATAAALVHRFSMAAGYGAGILGLAAVAAAVLINADKPSRRPQEAMHGSPGLGRSSRSWNQQ